MPEHQPEGAVLVGQLVDAVVVGVQAQPQHPQHQDRPLRHAGAAIVRVGLAFRARPLGKQFFKDREDALAQSGVGVKVPGPRNSWGMSSRDLGSSTMSAMSTWPNVIWGAITVRIRYFAWRRFCGGCPALRRLSPFSGAKTPQTGQNERGGLHFGKIFNPIRTL